MLWTVLWAILREFAVFWELAGSCLQLGPRIGMSLICCRGLVFCLSMP